ncbi:DUF3080 family protein [Paraglaciecola aestuariivivens]
MLGFSLLCILLFSCDSHLSLQKHLDSYQSRLAKVLDAEAIVVEEPYLLPYPKLQQLQHQQNQAYIKLFEFYQLKGCELFTLVAERNTALGKVQLPSTRYVYERKLLLAIDDCLAQTQATDLKTKLAQWKTHKQNMLPYVWADLIQLSNESKHHLQGFSGYIDGQSDGLVATTQAWQYLLKLAQQPIDISELEAQLKQLQQAPLTRRVWFSQLLISQNLQALTPWLITHTQNLSCAKPNDKTQIEYLTNVFKLFFIEKIQPLASILNHYHYQIDPLFTALIEAPYLSQAFKQRLQLYHLDGFEQYQQAMTEHIKFWQGLFKDCGIAPGNL